MAVSIVGQWSRRVVITMVISQAYWFTVTVGYTGYRMSYATGWRATRRHSIQRRRCYYYGLISRCLRMRRFGGQFGVNTETLAVTNKDNVGDTVTVTARCHLRPYVGDQQCRRHCCHGDAVNVNVT